MSRCCNARGQSRQIDARYERDYAIAKDELECLRVRTLQELTKRICEAKIASME